MDPYQIGQRIREFRVHCHYTQAALAEAADLSVPYLSHIERGVKRASLESLLQIAAALHVPVGLLLGEEPQAGEAGVLIPEVCALLNDCSSAERQVILETSKALKRALREQF